MDRIPEREPSELLGQLDFIVQFDLDQWATDGGRVPDESNPPPAGTTSAHFVRPTGQRQPNRNGTREECGNPFKQC
jgi:hypothetical protein